MTSSYLKALLKLSGDEALADARMRLIDGLNWEELEIVAVEGITGCTNRKVRERLVCAMLNILKENPNVEPLTVPKTEYRGSAPVAHPGALQKHNTETMTATTTSVAKRKRTVPDSDGEPQEAAWKAIKNEPIRESSCNTIDLREDEDKAEDTSDTNRMQIILRQNDEHPPILPKIIDLEDPVKDEAERCSVAPPVMLSSNQSSTTDLNFIAFPITFPAGSVSDPNPRLRIGIWAPDPHGGGAWLPLHNLAGGDGRAIHAKFIEDYIPHSKTGQMYRTIVGYTERFMQRGMCVNHYLYRSSGASKYTSAEGDKDRACDHCNGRMRLCVRVILDAVGPKLCVFPLHDKFRAGQTSVSLGAYVRTNGVPFKFGEGNARRPLGIPSFSIS